MTRTLEQRRQDLQTAKAALAELQWLDDIEAGVATMGLANLRRCYRRAARPPEPGAHVKAVEARKHQVRRLLAARIETLEAATAFVVREINDLDMLDAALALCALQYALLPPSRDWLADQAAAKRSDAKRDLLERITSGMELAPAESKLLAEVFRRESMAEKRLTGGRWLFERVLKDIKRAYLDQLGHEEDHVDYWGLEDNERNRAREARALNPAKLGVQWPGTPLPGFDPRAGGDLHVPPEHATDTPTEKTEAQLHMERMRKLKEAANAATREA